MIGARLCRRLSIHGAEDDRLRPDALQRESFEIQVTEQHRVLEVDHHIFKARRPDLHAAIGEPRQVIQQSNRNAGGSKTRRLCYDLAGRKAR